MKRKKSKYKLAFLTLFCLSHSLYASDNYTTSPYDFQISHIEGKGIGYTSGYTSGDLFLSLPEYCNVDNPWLPFLDLRGHAFDNGKWAANGGIGLRYIDNRVWGANLFYDYRKTSHANFNQVGIGIESLGCDWDFRFNAYLPVGKKISKAYEYNFNGFQGNHAIITHQHEQALHGLDAEIGTSIASCNNLFVYGGIGPYYLAGRNKHTVGAKARERGQT